MHRHARAQARDRSRHILYADLLPLRNSSCTPLTYGHNNLLSGKTQGKHKTSFISEDANTSFK